MKCYLNTLFFTVEYDVKVRNKVTTVNKTTLEFTTVLKDSINQVQPPSEHDGEQLVLLLRRENVC